MPTERTDQPDNVTTQEAPRPRDADVVTSDSDFIPESKPGPGEAGSSDQAAAKPDDQGGSTETDSATATPTKAPPKRNRSAERRIRKLSAKLAASEAREAENARQLQELAAEVETLKTATPKAKEPMLQDFPNPREYAKAYAKWEASHKQADPPPRKPAPPKLAASTPADPAPPPRPDKEIEAFQARGLKKLGDEFQEALQEVIPVNQLMGEYILDSSVGPELYVHLANNPEEAKAIYDSSTPRALKALKALEEKGTKGELDVGNEGELTVEGDQADGHEEKGGTPPPRKTKAPTPPSTVKDGGDAALKPDPESESVDEYCNRRKKEEARRAGLIT